LILQIALIAARLDNKLNIVMIIGILSVISIMFFDITYFSNEEV
jgi:hypothetical protein